MNQDLSDLMDGEIDGSRLQSALSSVAKDDAKREAWRTYHLIGECLRGEPNLARRSSTEKIMARLADEPTVLAPRARISKELIGTRTRVALAMAASVATLGVVGIMASRQPAGPQPAEQIALQVKAPAQQVASEAPLTQVNDYLLLHRQFANAAGIQQATLRRDAQGSSERNTQAGSK